MIVLDPDLEPEPVAGKAALRRVPASRPENRVPSARSLARFLGVARTAANLSGKVSVLLTTDTGIRRLNRQFRGKDKATDVLSFPAGGPAAGEIAGDMAISVPTARRQGAEQGHSLSVELKILILHGLLHLAGYDHETDAGQMARRERKLRTQLGLPQGLIERVGTKPVKRSRPKAGTR